MCRWIAYHGKPITLDTLITKPAHSLIDQSLNSRMSVRPDGTVVATNGDGFGMGWYSGKAEPGLFKVPVPAWHNENIVELCSQIQSPLFMAHIRAASTGAIQRTNAHPFKYKHWLFQHNGYIGHFPAIRRDLQFAIAPEIFPYLEGTTDSETFFLLALTYGLETDPKTALEQAIARVTEACRAYNVPVELNLSCAMSDGHVLYTLRYADGATAHSQYYSTHADCMKDLDESSDTMPRRSVVVVSEPLDQSGEHWQEVPVGSFVMFRDGKAQTEMLSI